MSMFAVVAVVCTMSACNEYVVDTARTAAQAEQQFMAQEQAFDQVWGDETDLNKWLDKYHIGETVFEIVSLEFETQELPEELIP